MRAWESTGHFRRRDRVRLTSRPDPVPGPQELLVEVCAFGVCRTDLHVTDGGLSSHRPAVVPGHEAVGTVLDSGDEPLLFERGDRVGQLAISQGADVHVMTRGAEARTLARTMGAASAQGPVAAPSDRGRAQRGQAAGRSGQAASQWTQRSRPQALPATACPGPPQRQQVGGASRPAPLRARPRSRVANRPVGTGEVSVVIF